VSIVWFSCYERQPSVPTGSNCDEFPEFTQKELYNYLVLSKHRSYDDSEMGARRQLKAKVFYQEGHISDIKCHHISEKCSHCLIKCSCLPSIPTKDKKKKPFFTLKSINIFGSFI
jgi:hypothetical protein